MNHKDFQLLFPFLRQQQDSMYMLSNNYSRYIQGNSYLLILTLA